MPGDWPGQAEKLGLRHQRLLLERFLPRLQHGQFLFELAQFRLALGHVLCRPRTLFQAAFYLFELFR